MKIQTGENLISRSNSITLRWPDMPDISVFDEEFINAANDITGCSGFFGTSKIRIDAKLGLLTSHSMILTCDGETVVMDIAHDEDSKKIERVYVLFTYEDGSVIGPIDIDAPEGYFDYISSINDLFNALLNKEVA